MDKDIIEKLRELANEGDKTTLEVLCNACESKFEIYKQADCRANLSEWLAAEKAFKSKVDELSAKNLKKIASKAGKPDKIAEQRAALKSWSWSG